MKKFATIITVRQHVKMRKYACCAEMLEVMHLATLLALQHVQREHVAVGVEIQKVL